MVVGEASTTLLQAVSACLAQHGCATEWLTAPLPETPVSHRLLLLRAKTPDATSWAKQQQQYGVVVVPDPRTIERVKDRWTCRALLSRTGIRLPEAVWGTPTDIRNSPIKALLPVVLKQRWVHGLPLRLISTMRQLGTELGTHGSQSALIAERYIVGRHLTAYFIGTQVFVLAKRPLLGDDSETPGVLSPASTLVECISRYRGATGLGFGKIDIVESSSEGVYCVDGGVFPEFRSIPEAGVLLAHHLLTHLTQ
jgi:hypothetical protein